MANKIYKFVEYIICIISNFINNFGCGLLVTQDLPRAIQLIYRNFLDHLHLLRLVGDF